jgi:flagellar operon protein
MAGGMNINNVNPNIQPASSGSPQSRGSVSPSGFREALQNLGPVPAKANASAGTELKFSNHAIERMRARGIQFDPDKMEQIQMAVQKAASKGSKNTLLLSDDSALIVSVKDKTVVTVMDRSAMKENVFTNIDSTVVI